jgi:hypothetical protein
MIHIFNANLRRHFFQTNVTAKRQQDSEANETHLEGYGGNVRLHTHHVAFGTGPEKKNFNKYLTNVFSSFYAELL